MNNSWHQALPRADPRAGRLRLRAERSQGALLLHRAQLARIVAKHITEHAVVVFAQAGSTAFYLPIGVGQMDRLTIDSHAAEFGVLRFGPQPPARGVLIEI